MSRRDLNRKDLGLWAIFRAPLAVAILSLVGLVGALLEDGLWDWLGSLFLAVAVVVTVWALIARRR